MTDEHPIDFQEPPPPAPTTIDELHVWIGVFRNGEDVLNGIDGFDRALMHTHREKAEAFGPVARRIQLATQHDPNPMLRIELRTYRRV